MKNVFNIMSAVSFVGVLFILGMLVFVNVTRESREEKNRLYIENVVKQAIIESMPLSTGKVAQ
tara:strand:+ start:389 stop:577 length:189 start_codon:yes stop_codon:yes gene_type:complete